MDGIQAEANSIFRRLEQTEGVVVLFDEFDELVRERGSDPEAFSRFLTTAMLPKLASLHKRATLVFIIATNNIDSFDLAIRRRGRFDLVLQMMPPTYEAKISKTDWGSKKLDIGKKFQTLGVKISPQTRQQIRDLTFSECEDFANELAQLTSAKAAGSALTRRWKSCTLRSPVTKAETKTWAERCKDEAIHNR
jgi:SpoVK/Ycf46/Vps4 family AAA+-type ATPase